MVYRTAIRYGEPCRWRTRCRRSAQLSAGIPRSGEVWAEPSLLARLGADVGDEIEVGSLRLRVTQTLEFRPDEGWRFMEVAPTALLNLEDVERSGLLAPGSIAEYEALYAGNDRAVAEFRSELEPLLTRDQELARFSRRSARSRARRLRTQSGFSCCRRS